MSWKKNRINQINYICTNGMKVLSSEESELPPLLFDPNFVPDSLVESHLKSNETYKYIAMNNL